MSSLIIRTEEPSDYRTTEELCRNAFWDGFQPGADEHFILHLLRNHPDFIPELNLVAEVDSKIVAQIVYSKSRIVSEDEPEKEYPVITFGPVSVLKELQRQGYGKQLINYSINKARELGYEAIVIYGDPRYYHRYGFRCGERFDVKNSSGLYATSLMILPLQEATKPLFYSGKFAGRFHESECFSQICPEEFEQFDATFPPREKHEGTQSQLEFQVMISLVY